MTEDTTKTTRRTLVQRIAGAMDRIGRVPKNGRNTFHNYDYATESDIADAVRAALAAEEIVCIPSVEECLVETLATKHGTMRLARVRVRYTLTDGVDTIDYVMWGEGTDAGDKAVYKAVTGATKYALLKAFHLSTGDDQDPEREENTPPRRVQAARSRARVEVDTAALTPEESDTLDSVRHELSDIDDEEGLKLWATHARAGMDRFGPALRKSIQEAWVQRRDALRRAG